MDETADTIDMGSDPLDVFSSGGTDTTPITTAADNPSNGLDVTSMFNNLLGTAGNAFTAAQNSQAAQSIAQAQIAATAAQPSNPLAAIFPNGISQQWLLIGAGIVVLALILRK